MEQLSPRLIKIITHIAVFGEVSAKELLLLVGGSRTVLSREVAVLISLDYIKRQGKGPSVRYSLGISFYKAPINIEYYFSFDQDIRVIAGEPNYFKSSSITFFEEWERAELIGLAKDWHARYLEATPIVKKKELERLTIELAWKSSQIEGNTYSLLDTEKLIKEKEEARGHSHEEATMILNHKDTLEYIYLNKNTFTNLSKKEIENIHSLLVKGLGVQKGLRRGLVGIIGTNYKPLDNLYQLEEQYSSFLDYQSRLVGGLEKSFAALSILSYMQLFEDGNKRTSRMVSNAMLLAHDMPPFSYRSIDDVEYKKAIILVYEKGNFFYLKKLFKEQFRLASTFFS